MFDRLDSGTGSAFGPAGSDDELLRELERNTARNIGLERLHERVHLRCGVTAASGNASERRGEPCVGTTLDLSAGGCLAVFPSPLQIGNVYLLRFDRTRVALPATFARCLRGRMMSEDSFEFGFAFFASIDLAEAIEEHPSATTS